MAKRPLAGIGADQVLYDPLGVLSPNNVTVEDKLKELGAATASDIIVVETLADLPTPTLVDGVLSIRLDARQYLLDSILNSTFPLAPPTSGTAFWTTIRRFPYIYSGTDACFRELNASGNIELNGPTEFQAPNGAMFNMDVAASSRWFIQGFGLPRFTNCKSLGTMKGSAGFNTFFGTYSNFEDGLVMEDLDFNEHNTMFVNGNNNQTLKYDGQTANFTSGETVTGGTSGATGVVEFDRDDGASGQLTLSGVSGVFQDDEALTGSSTGVAVVNGTLQKMVIFTVKGSSTAGSVNFVGNTFFADTNETFLDLRSEIESGVDSIVLRGNQSENILAPTAFASGSLDTDSTKIFSGGNTFISNTQPSALLNFKGNSTATVISSASSDGSNAVLVAGTWTCTKQSLFTCTTAGRITSNSERSFTAAIDVIATADTPTADTVAIYIALNGTPITATGISQLLEAGDAGTISTLWELDLNKDDFLEVFVENQTDGTDITVIDIIFRSR